MIEPPLKSIIKNLGSSYNGLLYRTLNPGDVGSNPMLPTKHGRGLTRRSLAPGVTTKALPGISRVILGIGLQISNLLGWKLSKFILSWLHSIMVYYTALSRQRYGFDSRWGRQFLGLAYYATRPCTRRSRRHLENL